MTLSRRFVMTLGTLCLWGSMGTMSAVASDVALVDGRHYDSESAYPSVTDLVVITRGTEELLIIPNDQVTSIDGAPYHPNAPMRPLGDLAPEATAVKATLLNSAPGSELLYTLSRTTDSWVRHGQRMDKKPSQHFDGLEQETVLHGADPAEIVLQKVRLKGQGPSAVETDRSYQRLSIRPDGYYLVGEGPALPGEKLQESVFEWPRALNNKAQWRFGPIAHGGHLEITQAQVTGQETISVPAGTFPNAYKVTSLSYLFAGDTHNHGVRFVTPYGTIALTTWLVPGLGVVQRDFHVHMHVDAFPADKRKAETPYVLDDHGSERLKSYRPAR
jgi:hypothetical protein